jgi:hypothetical protein
MEWEVWWSRPDAMAKATLMDAFHERSFAEGKGVAIERERGGWVTLVHVINRGMENEYSTYWTLIDAAANNGRGRYKFIAMAAKNERQYARTRRSNTVITDDFTPGAIEL